MEPMLNEKESKKGAAKMDIEDEDNNAHLKDDTADSPEENSDDGALFTKDDIDQNQESSTKIKLLWIMLLEKNSSQSGEDAINSAKRGMMFAVMEKTEGHWRRSIINKICNNTWQILDKYGLSVVGTVDDSNNDGPSKGWGKITDIQLRVIIKRQLRMQNQVTQLARMMMVSSRRVARNYVKMPIWANLIRGGKCVFTVSKRREM